jgi:hypothetical protein
MTYPAMAQDLLDTLDAHRLSARPLLVIRWAESGDGADRTGAGAHRGWWLLISPGGLSRSPS